MKVYVWDGLVGITQNYHDGGGVLIVTDRDPAEVWRDYVTAQPAHPYNHALDPEAVKSEAPNLVLNTDAAAERVIVFPDSGCC